MKIKAKDEMDKHLQEMGHTQHAREPRVLITEVEVAQGRIQITWNHRATAK